MTGADDPRQRLGGAVRRRRRELQLSVPAAARLAGINRDTWRNMENGSRELRNYLHAPIERVLWWKPGSAEAVLAGGEPREVERGLPAGHWAGILRKVRDGVEAEELAELYRVHTAGTVDTALTPPIDDDGQFTDPDTGEAYTDPDERELWGLTRLPAEERRKLIYYVRSERQRQQAEQRRKAG